MVYITGHGDAMCGPGNRSKSMNMNMNTMTAAELSRAIAAADKRHFALADKMIAAGRGHETTTTIACKTDALSTRFIESLNRCSALQFEKRARMAYHGSCRPIKRVTTISQFFGD